MEIFEGVGACQRRYFITANAARAAAAPLLPLGRARACEYLVAHPSLGTALRAAHLKAKVDQVKGRALA